MAEHPQPLDAGMLIRRKRTGDEPDPSAVQPAVAAPQSVPAESVRAPDLADDAPLKMKPRETAQLAAVHVRIPEQIARGLRLMSVLEGRQTQELAAEAFEAMLTKWNQNWRASVPPKG